MNSAATWERRRLSNWHALQAAAISLVDARGFTDVTVDDIAAAAGVSRRTFFNHFATKAAALFDPGPEDAERLALLLAEAVGRQDLWPALSDVCVAFVADHEDVIAVRRRLVAEWPELDRYHRTAHRHVEQTLVAWARDRRPDDHFTAVLMAEMAAAVMISAFEAWPPDADPGLFPQLVRLGFDRVALTDPPAPG